MNPYNSRVAAIWFGIAAVLMWVFLAFGPVREAPWYLRFVFLPLMSLYLWATPPRTKK